LGAAVVVIVLIVDVGDEVEDGDTSCIVVAIADE
jgi:biotin carboxyl carrier protein